MMNQDGLPLIDTRWPSDNQAGIPTLLPELQSDAVHAPLICWGSRRGGRVGNLENAGTLHFYTEDVRFEAIWKTPQRIAQSSIQAIVEPNFSVYNDMPMALALYQIWRKRWLARYWQHHGKQIFVDMNVSPAYADINLLGVPQGWTAFATRGYDDYLDDLANQVLIANNIAYPNRPTMLIYGGGRKVVKFCQDNLLWHYHEDRTAIREMRNALEVQQTIPSPDLFFLGNRNETLQS